MFGKWLTIQYLIICLVHSFLVHRFSRVYEEHDSGKLPMVSTFIG